MPESKMSVYEFGRRLMETKDLDPVYVVLWKANLPRPKLLRFLLAYWCFYHCGTAGWITDHYEEGEGSYWEAMRTAAGSKEYLRSPERRHYRGGQALASVEWLQQRGIQNLYAPILFREYTWTAKGLTSQIITWRGFGTWISFKVADMLERLGLCEVTFDQDTAMYEGSPTEGAKLLYVTENPNKNPLVHTAVPYAVQAVLSKLGTYDAPPRYERKIGLQEVETILCKWKSYIGGYYHVGEDIASLKKGLEHYPHCKTSAELLAGGKKGGLW